MVDPVNPLEVARGACIITLLHQGEQRSAVGRPRDRQRPTDL